ENCPGMEKHVLYTFSNGAEPGEGRTFLQENGIPYLVKPFEVAELISQARKLLQKAQAAAGGADYLLKPLQARAKHISSPLSTRLLICTTRAGFQCLAARHIDGHGSQREQDKFTPEVVLVILISGTEFDHLPSILCRNF